MTAHVDPGLTAARRMARGEPDWPGDDPGPPEPEEPGTETVRTLRSGRGDPGAADAPAHKRYPTVDWHRLFEGAPDDTDWLVPDLIARGQSYSLVSPAKAGKSLLMLDVAAAIAAGRPALGNPPQDPVRVLYVDHENSRDDLAERLRDMGYGPQDLDNLRYLSFPTMPPLDGPTGGSDIVDVAAHHGAELIIIDTVARVVAGEENSADTYRALYRHTLSPLKAARRAVVRLDHRGKGPNATARGSSAKQDDVDVVWQLTQIPGPEGEAYVTLKCERQRGSAHPEQINIVRDANPHLRHVARPPDLSLLERNRIGSCIEAMKQIHLPADTGARRARVALREKNHRFGNTIIAAAVKARKAAAMCPEVDRDTFEELS